MTASAFSADGSVLAIVAGAKVTLWDPETSRFAAVMPLAPEHSSAGAPPVHRLLFIPGTPYLVGASDSFVAVWNILTASLHWAMDVPVSALAVDPVYGVFVIAVPGTRTTTSSASSLSAAAAAVAGPSGPPSATVPLSEAVTASGKPPTSSDSGRPPATGSSLSSSQQQWQPAPRQKSHILVFDPQSPSPRFHSVVYGTIAPTLLYTAPGTPQHIPAASGDQVSPLMVLAENRAYTLITVSGDRESLWDQ